MNASFTGLAEARFQNDDSNYNCSSLIGSLTPANHKRWINLKPPKLIVKKKAEEAGLRKRDDDKKIEKVSEKDWKRKGFIRQSSEITGSSYDGSTVKPNVTYR